MKLAGFKVSGVAAAWVGCALVASYFFFRSNHAPRVGRERYMELLAQADALMRDPAVDFTGGMHLLQAAEAVRIAWNNAHPDVAFAAVV